MQTQTSFTVDDAVALLFPDDNFVVADKKDKCSAFTEDMDSYLAVLPSSFSDPMSPESDAAVFDDVWDMNIEVKRESDTEPVRTVDVATEEAKSETPDQDSSSPAPQKKRLVAWTPEEHKRFVFALEQLRTEDTESYNGHGKKTRGLGPGIAELIALAVRTRTAAQVRSHAQKYFAKQRKEMGLPLW
mmetsp:Transcript_28001/g.66563  ORF Transcript_28001/g.66563 Transcript_28001/m.66563 type:complete len:187 (-) Transcript_28001:92-652(-)